MFAPMLGRNEACSYTVTITVQSTRSEIGVRRFNAPIYVALEQNWVAPVMLCETQFGFHCRPVIGVYAIVDEPPHAVEDINVIDSHDAALCSSPHTTKVRISSATELPSRAVRVRNV
jgi:hypothetical protein